MNSQLLDNLNCDRQIVQSGLTLKLFDAQFIRQGINSMANRKNRLKLISCTILN
jgi:hypothetical protein